MTTFLRVGHLRAAIKDLPDDMPVALEIDQSSLEDGDKCDLAQGELKIAGVETRCDDVERLYLWADGNVVEGDERGDKFEAQGR